MDLLGELSDGSAIVGSWLGYALGLVRRAELGGTRRKHLISFIYGFGEWELLVLIIHILSPAISLDPKQKSCYSS